MASGGRCRRPRRRSRAKVRKIKYLSLSRHLTKAVEAQQSLEKAPASESPLPEEAAETLEDGGDGGGQEQQLGPFPLHPETSTLFAAAPSLTDILGVSAGGGESSSASPDVSSGTGFPGEEDDLARRALRGRERWAYCSSSPSATTSSSCSSAASTGASSGAARSLLLKLDHEEILAAWADRGSLYISGAADAADLVAPKLELDSVFVEVGPYSQHTVAGAWSAPEMAGRAERVRRYKEKRQSRLFAKRIRYEVRRFNAAKRPRLKESSLRHRHQDSLMLGLEPFSAMPFRHRDLHLRQPAWHPLTDQPIVMGACKRAVVKQQQLPSAPGDCSCRNNIMCASRACERV